MTDEVRTVTAIADGEEIRVLVQDRYGVTWVAPMGSPPEGDAWRRLAGTGMQLQPSLSLVEFLTARFDEDEAAVRPVVEEAGGGEFDGPSDECQYGLVTIGAGRVLREVEAKRAIVARAGQLDHVIESMEEDDDDARWPLYRAQEELGKVLADLAAVYADHPDYREEWRP